MTISGASVDAIVKKVLLAAHPVGSFYVSADATDPSTLWGGVWERLPEGTFLMACGDSYTAGATGGEAVHTLTASEMPSHSHPVSGNVSISGSVGSGGSHGHTITALGPGNVGNWWSSNVQGASKDGGGCGYPGFLGNQNENNGGWKWYSRPGDTSIASNMRDKDWFKSSDASYHSHSLNISSASLSGATASAAGSGQAHNNLPPYLAVYIWQRTA